MKQTLADFSDLTAAERKLRDWLQSGNREFCVISNAVPASATDDVTLRATFLRYLALGGCDDCGLPETGLRVIGAYILGEKMSAATQGLDLDGASLPGDLALVYCHIPDLIRLRSGKLKNLFLDGSHLKQGMSADGLQAEGDVFLRGGQVQGKVRLPGAKLGGNLECDGAHMSADGTVLNCDGLQAEGSFFLRRAQVQGEVRLLGATLGGDLNCNGVRLTAKGKALVVNRARIKGNFFLLYKAQITGSIDLTAANIGGINDDPDCWPIEVILNRCRYGAFLGRSPTDAKRRLRWLALQQPDEYGQDFWPDPYEHCAKVLREMGHGADAREILIEKERLQRKARRDRIAQAIATTKNDWLKSHDEAGADDFTLKASLSRVLQLRLSWTLRWIWDHATGFFLGYGRRPIDAVWRGLVPLWLFGSLVFYLAARDGEIKPNLPQIQVNAAWHDCIDGGARRLADHAHQVACFHDQPEGQSYPRFNAVFYSTDTLFPVVSLEMQSYWIPDETQPFGKWARWYLWAHIALGWALTLLAVAGFSGLIKTDNTK